MDAPRQVRGEVRLRAEAWLRRFDGRMAVGWLAVVVTSVAAGTATALNPALTGLAVVLVLGTVVLLLLGGRVPRLLLVILAVILVGYAFLGRGFAYIGIAPVYVGEMALPVALLALIRGRQPGRFQLLHGLLLAFMGWSALQTLPYLAVHGIDALRDSVTWAYAIYAIVVSFVLTRSALGTGVDLYRRLAPLFLLWVPISAVMTRLVTLPTVPGSDVPIVVFKGGDIGVHLAGIAAFLFLGLYADGRVRRVAEPVMWAFWLIAVAVAGVFNRGGLLAASTAAAALLYVRAAGRWLALAFVALALIVPLSVVDPRIELGTGRVISVGQMVDNIASVFGQAENPGLEGTKEFRLRWWGAIIDYTIGGPFFWTGKGYGVNLADDDGFQPTADRSLRAPHNGHVEILARSGVPGLALWILLHAVYGLSVFRAAVRARSRGDTRWVQLLGLVFIYWLAALVNASFDPYLQGPQGGIWFWTIFGVGLAAIRMADSGDALAAPGDISPRPIGPVVRVSQPALIQRRGDGH